MLGGWRARSEQLTADAHLVTRWAMHSLISHGLWVTTDHRTERKQRTPSVRGNTQYLLMEKQHQPLMI